MPLMEQGGEVEQHAPLLTPPSKQSNHLQQPDSAHTSNGIKPADDDKILGIAREEIRRFHESEQTRLEGQTVPSSVQQGCNIELNHMGLESLPEALIDIIKGHAERLALNQNRLTSLSGLSIRLHECTRLHYLVLRNNKLREFPRVVLKVPTLKTLDIKGNHVHSIPEDLDRLKNLNIFDIRNNKVTKLPACIGRMNGLSCIVTRKNPIVDPPRAEWAETHDEDNRNDLSKDRLETAKLKKLFQERLRVKKSFTELDGSASESVVETPRPMRRKVSGRFPIKPSVGGIESYSPDPPPVSPLPFKLSQAQTPRLHFKPSPESKTPLQRPSVTPNPPSTNSNERIRSSSESQMATSLKKKRMGLISASSQRSLEQQRLDTRKQFRQSHLRGVSDGSALIHSMRGGSTQNMGDSSASTSPVEGDLYRLPPVKRLSVLPEGKRKSGVHDPILELARNALFVMVEIYEPVHSVTETLRGVKEIKSLQLERQCWKAYNAVDSLRSQILQHDDADEEDEEFDRKKIIEPFETAVVKCGSLLQTFGSELRVNMKPIIESCDRKLVRMFMLLLHGGLIESRNAILKFGCEIEDVKKNSIERYESQSRDAESLIRRPGTSIRHRHVPQTSTEDEASNLTQRPNIARQRKPSQNGTLAGSRSPSASSLGPSSHTRHEQNFRGRPSRSPSAAASRVHHPSPYSAIHEDRGDPTSFEHIYDTTYEACRAALQTLPRCLQILQETRRQWSESYIMDNELNLIDATCDRCKAAIEATNDWSHRFGTVYQHDEAFKHKPEYWQCCADFTEAFFMFAESLRKIMPIGLIAEDLKSMLDPVFRHVKDAARKINKSPWPSVEVPPGNTPDHHSSSHQTHQQHQVPGVSHLAYHAPHAPSVRSLPPMREQGPMPPLPNPPSRLPTLAVQTVLPPPTPSESASAASSQSGINFGYITPLPATPMSAALGPAASATVPISSPSFSVSGHLQQESFGGLVPQSPLPSALSQRHQARQGDYLTAVTSPPLPPQQPTHPPSAMRDKSRSISQKR